MKAPKEEAGERRLIEAAQKDPSRFAELYESNFNRVYAYIVRRVGDRDAAQDLASEVFHQALANEQVAVTLRQEKGHDIDAACGQLRLRTEMELGGAS